MQVWRLDCSFKNSCCVQTWLGTYWKRWFAPILVAVKISARVSRFFCASLEGSAQKLWEVVKKVRIFSTFACLHHFSIEKRWFKWLGGGKCRPVPTSVGRTLVTPTANRLIGISIPGYAVHTIYDNILQGMCRICNDIVANSLITWVKALASPHLG